MGIEDIAELILLLIFFVVSPIIQKRIAKKRAESAPEQAPGPPDSQGPGSPGPPIPQQAQPATAGDYADYLAEGLLEHRKQALRLRTELKSSPLHQLSDLKPLVDSLQERANAEIASTVELIDSAVSPVDGTPQTQAIELSRVTDNVRNRVGQARVYTSLFATLAEQRLSAGRRQRLAIFDKLLKHLTSQGQSNAESRRQWALMWDRDPAVPAALIGAGSFGLAAMPQARLGLASGWAYLARGIGFDLLAEFPDLTEELKRAAMVGPLADRPVATYDYAQAAFDLPAALTAWIPNLVADMVGALLLGRAYAVGVVHSELSRSLRPIDTVTVKTEGGRYHFEPPLLVRLAVIDEVLSETGWADASNAMGLLGQRIALPTEAVYVLPNRMTRRLLLEPLLKYMQQVAEALLSKQLSAAKDKRLQRLLGGGLPSILQSKIEATRRVFIDGQLPEGDPIVLVCAAILAEADPAAERRSFESALVRSLSEKKVRRVRRPVHSRTPDRDLLRDALVLSEIL